MKLKKKPKYESIKEDLYGKILEGHYTKGQLLPDERSLCQIYQTSRITIRTCLEILEKEGLIKRTQGRGTIVSYLQGAKKNLLQSCAVLSRGFSPFFGEFMNGVSSSAQKANCLLYFAQFEIGEKIFDPSSMISQFMKNNVQNFIIWPHQANIQEEHIASLRGLGANFVFFDSTQKSPYADDLTLDNQSSIHQLWQHLNKQKLESIHYLGWENNPISTTKERAEAYQKLNIKQKHQYLFDFTAPHDEESERIYQEIQQKKPQAILSGNGYLLKQIMKKFLKNKMPIHPFQWATIDNEDSAFFDAFQVIRIQQNGVEFGQEAFQLLKQQTILGDSWAPQLKQIKGRIVYPSF